MRVDALDHFPSQRSLDQWRRLLPRELVEARHAQAANLEDVAEALGGDQSGAGTLELENRIRGYGGAVQDLHDVLSSEARVGEDLAKTRDDGARVVVDAGGHLL